MREFHTDTVRVDEVLEPVEYAIAQDAESFHQVQDTQLRIAVAVPFPGVIPRLWIYFTIDDEDYCTLRAVRRATAPLVVETNDS
jgi:hypothetical protein